MALAQRECSSALESGHLGGNKGVKSQERSALEREHTFKELGQVEYTGGAGEQAPPTLLRLAFPVHPHRTSARSLLSRPCP